MPFINIKIQYIKVTIPAKKTRQSFNALTCLILIQLWHQNKKLTAEIYWHVCEKKSVSWLISIFNLKSNPMQVIETDNNQDNSRIFAFIKFFVCARPSIPYDNADTN